MTSVRTIQRSSLGFRFFTIPFLFLPVITLALGGLIAYAEPPIGSAPAVIAKARPSVITILMRGMPATSTQALSGPGEGVGGVLRYYCPVDQHQIYNLGNFRHSLRPARDQPTLQLAIQRKNAQSTISLQNPSLPKVVP